MLTASTYAAFREELLKIAFGLDDAEKVLHAVKPRVIKPKVGPPMLPVGALTSKPQMVFNMTRMNAPISDMPRPDLKKHVENIIENGALGEHGHWMHPSKGLVVMPGRGDTTAFLRKNAPPQIGQGFQKVRTPEERKMVEGVIRGHELDELSAKPSMSFNQFGHISPDVILRENNRVATLPEHMKDTVGSAMKSMREAAGEAPFLRQYGVNFGEQRFSRHARKRITDMIEVDQVNRHKASLPWA